MHESLNFAGLHQLPILFVCENNSLAVTTPIEQRRANDSSISTLAYCHGVRASTHCGQDIKTVYDVAREAVACVRAGDGPRFLEFNTERERVHCGIEHEYRLVKDPLRRVNIDDHDIMVEIAEAFEFAKNSPAPKAPEEFVYAK